MQIVVYETSANAEGIILLRSLSLLIGKCFCAVQTDRYAEYPKLKELVERKDGLIAARATAPTFLKVLALTHLLLSLQPFTQQIAAANAQALPPLQGCHPFGFSQHTGGLGISWQITAGSCYVTRLSGLCNSFCTMKMCCTSHLGSL